MPEGPSLIIFREELLQFKGKTITIANGTVKTLDPSVLKDQKLKDIRTWGKHLLFYFGPKLTLRIHFLMFGKFYIDKKRDKEPQLHLVFTDKETLNFYTTSMQLIEQPLKEVYDWRTDVMNKAWDTSYVRKLVKAQPPETMVCDLLLDQDIFTGVGNIIKNEVLYRTGIHPESTIGSIPPRKLTAILQDCVAFSADFLKWRKVHKLTAHLEVYEKKVCPKHETKLEVRDTGKRRRKSFWCDECQKLY